MRRQRRQKHGQVLALGAVTMLVLALMMMISFSLTRAVHEKIRLQSHADSMTYSMATVGARAMNYYAYSNRATAAAAVSTMTLHAYHAQMTLVGAAFATARTNYAVISAEHFLIFLASCTPICTAWNNFRLGIQAARIAAQMGRESRNFYNQARNQETNFNNAVRAYSMLIDAIYAAQQSVSFHTVRTLQGNNLDSLHAINAPCASQLPLAVGAINVREFACALEGSPIDFMCIGGRATSPLTARSRVISNVANAARGDWPKNRTIPFPSLFHPTVLQRLMQQNGGGFSVPLILDGSARTLQGTSFNECTSNQNNRQGLAVCGADRGLLTSIFQGPLFAWTFEGQVYSNDGGGRHLARDAHTGQHNMWHGFARVDGLAGCLTAGECFTNFRSDTRAAQDYGQPKVFGHFSQSLRENWRCNRGPWELGANGKLTIGDGARGDGVLDFLPNDPASAISKSMIYFHRPDNWRFPPNAFDPYWKAKLHTMTTNEASLLLTAAGDVDGAAMAFAGPVDGRDRF